MRSTTNGSLVPAPRAAARGELDPRSESGAALAGLVGCSPAMQEIFALVRKIARNRSHVLITGETGTGKDRVARAIHDCGERRAGPFVPINCAAVPETLLESELFGHARGAFTGAAVDRSGLFEEARGGTLFLDEIGDMPLSIQAKLLRVLQDRTVRRLGSTRGVEIDVRIIAATHRQLRDAIAAGEFRLDLFYRLNVIPIHIPPLRERVEDIPALVESFLRRHAGGAPIHFSESALRRLCEARWTGNARELENCVERAVALIGSGEIRARDVVLLDPRAVPPPKESLEQLMLRIATDYRVPLRVLADAYADAAIHMSGGRLSRAARLLGVNRRTLYRREQRRRDGEPLGEDPEPER